MPSIVDYLANYGNSQVDMHDFAHASRLYVDDLYALAPKTSFIYYVVLSINRETISEILWADQRRDLEAGMLVKSCDLPKFQIDVETINQYNRKTNIQKKITYQPVSFSFHDDMSNVSNSLWVNYFRYYYRDTWWGQSATRSTNQITLNPLGYLNTKYSPAAGTTAADGRPATPGAYGLNNNQSRPFFNAITIYQLNQHRFTSYILVNPLITAWEHDQLDQSQGSKFATNRMQVAYETVFYGEGRVHADTPNGFATFHYDNNPSPLNVGNSNVFGPNGIIANVDDIFGQTSALLSGQSPFNPIQAAGLIVQGGNILKNASNVTSASLKAEGQSILNSAVKGALASGSGGLAGMLGGGLGSLSKALGFGPATGTMLVGSNFIPNPTTGTATDVVPGLTTKNQ